MDGIMSSPNSHAEVLTLSTSDYDLLWDRAFTELSN
jgi:hypothetical protein